MLAIILSHTVRVHVRVRVEQRLSHLFMYIFVLFAFGFPSAVLFTLEQHVSQVLSADSSERGGNTKKREIRERERGRKWKGKKRVLKAF